MSIRKIAEPGSPTIAPPYTSFTFTPAAGTYCVSVYLSSGEEGVDIYNLDGLSAEGIGVVPGPPLGGTSVVVFEANGAAPVEVKAYLSGDGHVSDWAQFTVYRLD